MAYITFIPNSYGKNVVMVVVGILSIYAHFCALCHPFNASPVDATFMEIVQKLPRNRKKIFSVIKIQFSLKIFGLNYFIVWVPSWFIVHPIILNSMGKL